MEWRQFFLQAFDYDRWANQQWLDGLSGFKNIDRAFKVLEHILDAQFTWLSRCGAIVHPQSEDLPLKTLFDDSHGGWLTLVSSTEFDEPIVYQNSRGQEFTQSFGSIVSHVINHGTYHRGRLRGLAEAEGYENTPETDLILYLREHNP